jgi:hypothetical protein
MSDIADYQKRDPGLAEAMPGIDSYCMMTISSLPEHLWCLIKRRFLFEAIKG